MIAEVTYRWLVHTPGRRPAHAFVEGSAAALCTVAVRHPAVTAHWQADYEREHCRTCERLLKRAANGHLREVVAQ